MHFIIFSAENPLDLDEAMKQETMETEDKNEGEGEQGEDMEEQQPEETNNQQPETTEEEAGDKNEENEGEEAREEQEKQEEDDVTIPNDRREQAEVWIEIMQIFYRTKTIKTNNFILFSCWILQKEGEDEDKDEEQLNSAERKDHSTDGQTGEENIQSDTAAELAGEASERDDVKEVSST